MVCTILRNGSAGGSGVDDSRSQRRGFRKRLSAGERTRRLGSVKSHQLIRAAVPPSQADPTKPFLVNLSPAACNKKRNPLTFDGALRVCLRLQPDAQEEGK